MASWAAEEVSGPAHDHEAHNGGMGGGGGGMGGMGGGGGGPQLPSFLQAGRDGGTASGLARELHEPESDRHDDDIWGGHPLQVPWGTAAAASGLARGGWGLNPPHPWNNAPLPGMGLAPGSGDDEDHSGRSGGHGGGGHGRCGGSGSRRRGR